jgi:DNA-binding transcriptional LysR family regulator
VDVQWLRVLVELADRGTLGAVAEATGYSKSAVAQQLAALQRSMGVPVVERVGRRLRLTPAGNVLLPSAREILASVDAARGALDAAAEPVGELRVAGFAGAVGGMALRAVKGLSVRYPRLTVRLQECEPREVDALLADDDIDVGIVYDYSLVPRYLADGQSVRLLAEVPMALVIPARQDAGEQEITRILGSGQTEWITNSRGTDDDELLHRVAAASTGNKVRIAHRIDSLPLLTELLDTKRHHPGCP